VLHALGTPELIGDQNKSGPTNGVASLLDELSLENNLGALSLLDGSTWEEEPPQAGIRQLELRRVPRRDLTAGQTGVRR
jgi:hypothetical protein